MPWIYEIYRAILVAFGTTQTILNLYYLSKKNGMELAAKQHAELPKTATIKQLKIKTTMMLLFGVIFLAAGLFAYFTHSFPKSTVSFILITFAIYAIVEAAYYRYWKTTGFAILGILLAAALIIFS